MTLLHRSTARGTVLRPRPGRVPEPGQTDAVQLPAQVRAVSVALALAAVAAGLAAPTWFQAHQVLLLAAGFLVGLPHGAVDHLLPARHAWVRRGVTSMAMVLAGYVALALVAWAGLRLAGAVVLPLLLVVSVLHFGFGDMATTDPLGPAVPLAGPTRSGVTRWVAAAGRGAPVVAGPMLAWPGPTGSALAVVGLGRSPSGATALLVGLGLLAFSAVAAGLALRAGRTGQALEIGLLVVLFVVLPPLAAFGVYFGGWHGLRHTARLLADDPRSTADLARGRLARPLGRFLRDAAVPSLVALSATVGLAGLAVGRADLAGPVFELLLALTVPHVVVVAWWDQHLDRRRPGGPSARRDSGGRQ